FRRYLAGFDIVRAENLHAPLALLQADLEALDRGRVFPMVARARKRGGQPVSEYYNAVKGFAVYVVRRLEASGMALPEARKAVAEKLNQLGVPPARGTTLTARTLKKWQEDVAEDIGQRGEAARFFHQCELENERRILGALELSATPVGLTLDEVF